jgi:hypothetical protein
MRKAWDTIFDGAAMWCRTALKSARQKSKTESVKNDGQLKKKVLKLWARTCYSSSTPAELTERFAALVAEPEFHKGEE